MEPETTLRPIGPEDNAAIAAIIRKVMPEFGASGPGFAINDPEVNDMFTAYSKKGCAFFIVTMNNKVVGGGGIAPLDGGDGTTCELRKMYFLPEARGIGAGKLLFDKILKVATDLGYRKCYLETLKGMSRARLLYERNGFKQVCQPMGNTGHFGCDTWYVRDL